MYVPCKAQGLGELDLLNQHDEDAQHVNITDFSVFSLLFEKLSAFVSASRTITLQHQKYICRKVVFSSNVIEQDDGIEHRC